VKYGINAEVYWQLFSRLLKREITARHDIRYAKTLIRDTKDEYRGIIARMPDIGGSANELIRNIYIGAVYIACYLAAGGSISPEDMSEIISDTLRNSTLVRFSCSRNDQTSEKYRRWIEKVAAWTQENRDRYPANWLLYYSYDPESDGTRLEFRRCALHEMCMREGCEEIAQALCATDFITADMGRATLIRTRTIAGGSDTCDFLYVKK